MPDRKVSLGGFREDPVLTSEFRDRERFLEALWSNADMAHLYTCENTADDIPGHYAVVIRTVLDKTKVAFYLLIPSTAALVVGLVLAVVFPLAAIGGTISTATIALACLLQACVAWCQH